MKTKIKEKIMKGFLMLFLCVCFVGFETSETLQALVDVIILGDFEFKRGNFAIAAVFYRKSCNLFNGCNRLGELDQLSILSCDRDM